MHNLRFSCCEYELQDGAPKLVGAYVPMAKRKNLKAWLDIGGLLLVR